jgi:hypothetical protein
LQTSQAARFVIPVPASYAELSRRLQQMIRQSSGSEAASSSCNFHLELTQDLQPAPLHFVAAEHSLSVQQALLGKLYSVKEVTGEAQFQCALAHGCWDDQGTLRKLAAVLAQKLLADVPSAAREALQCEGLQDCLKLCAAGGRRAIAALSTCTYHWPVALGAAEASAEDGNVVALAGRILANAQASLQVRIKAAELLWTMAVSATARQALVKAGVVERLYAVLLQLTVFRSPGFPASEQAAKSRPRSEAPVRAHEEVHEADLGCTSAEGLLAASLSALVVMVVDARVRNALLSAGEDTRTKPLDLLLTLVQIPSNAEPAKLHPRAKEISALAAAVLCTVLARDSAARSLSITGSHVRQLCMLLDSPMVVIQLHAANALAAFAPDLNGVAAQHLAVQLLEGSLALKVTAMLIGVVDGSHELASQLAVQRLSVSLEVAVHAVVHSQDVTVARDLSLQLVILAQCCLHHGLIWNDVLAVRNFSPCF